MKSLISFFKWTLLGGATLLSGAALITGLNGLMNGKTEDFLLASGLFFIGGAFFVGIMAVIIKNISSSLINLGAKNNSLLLKGDELKEHANSLGVSLTRLYNTNGLLNEPELQKRVLAAESHIREHNLRFLEVMSAVAAVISAAVAIISIWF